MHNATHRVDDDVRAAISFNGVRLHLHWHECRATVATVLRASGHLVLI